MCGIPWWTTDIGGFYGGDPEDPTFRELIIRWFQFGVFCPIFRLHGNRKRKDNVDVENSEDIMNLNGGPNEVWSFGEEAYEIIKELLFLREKLKSYILTQMKKAHETGIPVMRPLFFDFPQDAQTYDIGDEYMFGPDILVTPVAEKGERSRKVYLPNGAKWQEFDGSKEYDGGKWIEFEASLNKIPAFRKNGVKIF
jgi:alpha-D-xyloside xylohydrolase